MSYQLPAPPGRGWACIRPPRGPGPRRTPPGCPAQPSRQHAACRGPGSFSCPCTEYFLGWTAFGFELPDLTGCSHPRKCGPRVPPAREQEAPCLGARASSTCSAREARQASSSGQCTCPAWAANRAKVLLKLPGAPPSAPSTCSRGSVTFTPGGREETAALWGSEALR